MRPIGMGLGSSAAFVDWYGRGALDIILSVHPWYVSGGSYLYLQDLTADTEDGQARYLEPLPLPGLNGRHVQPLTYGDAGGFDLLGYAARNPGPRSQQKGRSIGWLNRYRNLGSLWAPQFGVIPDDLECAGQSLEAAVGQGPISSIALEYDGEGRTCAAIVSTSRDPLAYWPERTAAWNGDSGISAGEDGVPGSGYDDHCLWRGSPSERIVQRFPFGSDRQRPMFGAGRQIHSTQSLFSIFAACWRNETGGRQMALVHDVDQLTPCDPAGHPAGKPVTLRDQFFDVQVTTNGWQAGARPLLLLTGNSGYVSRLDPAHGFGESRLTGLGGNARVGSLAIPSGCMVQGRARLYVGDACGAIHLFAYDSDGYAGPPTPVLADGAAISHQAGPTGSLQGPVERRWGYTNPLILPDPAGGEPDLLVVDITGAVILYRAMAGSDGSRFHAGQAVLVDGRPLVVSWRSRPALWSDSELLFHTQEGLRIYRRDARDPARLTAGRPVQFSDGSPIGAGRSNGLSGRVVLEGFTSAGDGSRHLLAAIDGRLASDYMGIDSQESLVLSMRCVSDDDRLTLERGRPLALAGGVPLTFGMHNCGVTTLARPGGVQDIIVGAEDGHLYRFFDHEFASLRP